MYRHQYRHVHKHAYRYVGGMSIDTCTGMCIDRCIDMHVQVAFPQMYPLTKVLRGILTRAGTRDCGIAGGAANHGTCAFVFCGRRRHTHGYGPPACYRYAIDIFVHLYSCARAHANTHTHTHTHTHIVCLGRPDAMRTQDRRHSIVRASAEERKERKMLVCRDLSE